MNTTAVINYLYDFDAKTCDIHLRYHNTIATTNKTYIDKYQSWIDSKSLASPPELLITSYAPLHKGEPLQEVSRHCRHEVLVIQGLITFFIGAPLTVYDNIGGISEKVISDEVNLELFEKVRPTVFKYDNTDYSEDVDHTIDAISQDSDLICSLLDSWRKALYLQEESADANLFHDECILRLMHIFELISGQFHKELKEKLSLKCTQLVENFYEILYYKNPKEIAIKSNALLKEVLVSKELTFSNKIKYCLDKYGLLDECLDSFIDSMISIRNGIAHGRIVYRQDLIWPLPPFFGLTHESYDIIPIIITLTAQIIGCYIGISRWNREWEDTKSFLLVPERRLLEFINNPKEKVTKEQLLQLSNNTVTWFSIFSHHVQSPKKFALDVIADIFGTYLIDTELTEENAVQLYDISILFSECSILPIKEKAVENVRTIIKERYDTRWNSLRDIYPYLQACGISSRSFSLFFE